MFQRYFYDKTTSERSNTIPAEGKTYPDRGNQELLNPYGVALRFFILYTYTLKGASITLPLGNKGGVRYRYYFLETRRVGVVVFSKISVYSLLSFKFLMALLSLEHWL